MEIKPIVITFEDSWLDSQNKMKEEVYEFNKKNDYIYRMLDELNWLKTKIVKLKEFFETDEYSRLDDINRSLLIIQYNAMNTYWSCLWQRTFFVD